MPLRVYLHCSYPCVWKAFKLITPSHPSMTTLWKVYCFCMMPPGQHLAKHRQNIQLEVHVLAILMAAREIQEKVNRFVCFINSIGKGLWYVTSLNLFSHGYCWNFFIRKKQQQQQQANMHIQNQRPVENFHSLVYFFLLQKKGIFSCYFHFYCT